MKKESVKVILVSGGSRGLGEGIVKALLECTPHSVITFSRHETPAVKTFQKKFAKRFSFYAADLSRSAELESMMSEIEKKFGRLDALINNAGIAREGVLPVTQDEIIDEVIDINLKGSLRLTKAASRLMIRGNGGSIINISSIIGLHGYAGLSVYSASKAGIIGFTKSLAREFGRRKIRVNAIAPGYLETEMSSTLTQGQKEQIIRRTPLGRLGLISDVVPLVHYLISPSSEFVTGHTFVVDGGITC